MFLLFWMLQTCHATGQIYKMYFLQCQARCRRSHPADWADLTPHVTTSLPGLPKCCSCWSILLCPAVPGRSAVWLCLTPGEGSTTVPSSACQKKCISEPQVGCAVQQPNEASFKRPKAALWSVNRCNALHPDTEFSATGQNETQGLLQRDAICNSAVTSSSKLWQPPCLPPEWDMFQLGYMKGEWERTQDTN